MLKRKRTKSMQYPVKRARAGQGKYVLLNRPKRRIGRNTLKKKLLRLPKKATGKVKNTALTQFIKKVHNNDTVSTYRKLMIGNMTTNNLYSGGAYPSIGLGQKHLFTHYIKGGLDSTYTQDALEFVAFSPKKLVDAASVLYGGKTIAPNYELSTGNLPHSSQVNFNYCSYNVEMVNSTTHNFSVKIYTLHPIGGHTTQPLQDLNGAISSHLWRTAPARTLTAGGGEMAIERAFAMTDLTLKKWRVVATKKVWLEAGAKTSWGVTMKDKKISFEKLVDDSNNLYSYAAGTVGFIVETIPEPKMHYKAGDGSSTSFQYIPGYNAAESDFGFKVTEVYKIAEPENVADGNEGAKTALWSDVSMGPWNAGTRDSYMLYHQDPKINVATADIRT